MTTKFHYRMVTFVAFACAATSLAAGIALHRLDPLLSGAGFLTAIAYNEMMARLRWRR